MDRGDMTDGWSSRWPAGEVERAKERCRCVIDQINSLPLSRITLSCKASLLRYANSELRFLSRLSPSSVTVSSSVGYIESIVHILQHPSVNGVSCVRRPIRLSSYGNEHDSGSESVHVDVVCTFNRSPTWFIVSDRNPKYIHWCDSPKQKGLKSRVQLVLEAAQSTLTLKPYSIIFFFARGLHQITSQGLREDIGATEISNYFTFCDFSFEEVEGEWLNVIQRGQSLNGTSSIASRVYHRAVAFCIANTTGKGTIVQGQGSDGLGYLSEKAHMIKWSANVEAPLSNNSFSSLLSCIRGPSIVASLKPHHLLQEDLVNFDTTVLVAIVSEISNGFNEHLLKARENEIRKRFKGNYDFVLAQVKFESLTPIIQELTALLCHKRSIICKTVCSEFKELVSMCGGSNEKLRADCLLKCLTVVPDNPSHRMAGLSDTRKISVKNKIVFGTGDYWSAPTLTANMGFVRAISQTGMPLLTLEHCPRALLGD